MKEDWIIKGCINNQERAQRQLYVSYGPVVKSICDRYIKGEEASDVFHDCFLKIMGSTKKFNNNGSFEGWIKRIAVNFCLDYLRKNQKVKFVETPEDLAIEDDKEEIDPQNIDSSVVSNIGFTQEDLKTMLQKIPEVYSIVFSLHQIEKYSHQEIAKSLNINEQTSRSRLKRARKKLKHILIEETKLKLNQ